MQNFRGLRRRGWSGQIASLRVKVSVLFCFFTGATGLIFGHIPTHNTSLYVVLAKVVPFGGLKDKIRPLLPQKTKNWDFKQAVNGKLQSS